MSSFLALLARQGPPPDRALLARLAGPLVDCQPDRLTGVVDGPLGMVQGFLATREGAVAGPHTLGDLRLTGDVRLDDRSGLAARLRSAGVQAPDLDDDDGLVLLAYQTWGTSAWGRLRGEFSFALWDAARQQLHCVRDGMGVRPLFYADTGRVFLCANHVDAVRAHPDVPSTLNDAALVSFLRWGWNVDVHHGAFAAIRRLEAGHALSVDLASGPSAEVRHWSFPEPRPLRLGDDREYVDAFRAVLGEAVRDRMRQPNLAIQLSGGLDSTSLAATARRAAPSASIKGFTYAATSLFADREGEFAAAAAQQLGIAHAVDDTPWQPLAYLADPSFRTPEPVDDLDFLHTRRLLARMATHSRVLFVGEDGDTLFAPSGLALTAKVWGWGETLRRAFAYTLRHRQLPVLGFHLRDRLRRRPIERVYDPPPHWIRADLLVRTGPQDFIEPPRHPTRPGTKWLRGAYWQTGHEGDSFAYMRLPLEWRWPFLDTRLIEFVLAIPPIPFCQRKQLMRAAFASELPPAVLRRPKTVLPPAVSGGAVTGWIEAGRPGIDQLHSHVAEYVDLPALRSILMGSDAAAIGHAWRGLHLSRWLAGLSVEREVSNIQSVFNFLEATHESRPLG